MDRRDRGWLLAVVSSSLLATAFLVVTCGGSHLEVDVAGRVFGIGREPCTNAFGHHPDLRIQVRVGESRLTLWRTNNACRCSLCRAAGGTGGRATSVTQMNN